MVEEGGARAKPYVIDRGDATKESPVKPAPVEQVPVVLHNLTGGVRFDLFFTGEPDPLSCVIIGEDVSNRQIQRTETEMNSTLWRMKPVYSNNKKATSLVFGPGNQLGSVTIGGTRVQSEDCTFAMADALASGSKYNARSFFSADGRKYEWRKCANVSGAYDLYALNPPIARIAAFRRCSEDTPVGKSTGLLLYTFFQDGLLLHTLITLCLNRWMDM
ncbi:hypothetical protein K438DRAFT_1612749 [Mycena galopus ATCC 62051]|nr:hypothetical protein K438DRAFT_1612749 [Mycena galopus ATCC 62051]